MTKELLVMRHAKSSWKEDSLPDHERPLNKRGRNDAPLMAGLLVEQDLQPDLILSSSAVRARDTAELVARSLNHPEPGVEIVDDFYLATPDVYVEFLQRLSDDFFRPMVVGHNPGLEQLVNGLSNSWQTMPTAAVAHFVLEIVSWSDLDADSTPARLCHVFRPKELF